MVKRFDIIDIELLHSGIGVYDKDKELTGGDVIDLLNNLYEFKINIEKDILEYSKIANCNDCEYNDCMDYPDGEFEVCVKGLIQRLHHKRFCKEWGKF